MPKLSSGERLHIKLADTQYEDRVAESVREDESGYEVKRDDGWMFLVPKVEGIAPKAGDTIRFYGMGIGFMVRGVDVNGVTVFYRTPEEEDGYRAQQQAESIARDKAEFEQNKASLDARYAALPRVFRNRIDRFRRNNPEFRWQYEHYEMFCCEQAVLIAEALKTVEAIVEFQKLSWESQVQAVPGLSDCHSGNTFRASVALAGTYLSNADRVSKLMGALAPLVGSRDYGDLPDRG